MSATLEDLLSETIRPDPHTTADWDDVVGRVHRRHRQRTATFRAAVVGFVLLGGVALLVSATGNGAETVPAPADLAQPVEVIESRWPSASAIFDATTPRPTWHLAFGWFVGLGLPLLTGLIAWIAAPRHLRVEVPGQRFTRLYLGALVGFATGLVLVGVLWLPTFFFYDALAVATSQSLLFTLFAGALNGLPWLAGAAGFALAMTPSGLYSTAATTSRVGLVSRFRGMVELGVAFIAAFSVGTFVRGLEGLLRWPAWRQSVGTSSAGHGMWRPMVPRSRTFLNAEGPEISPSGSLIALLLAALFAVLMWRYCRRSIDMALAGERFSFDVIGRLRGLPLERFFGGALILVGLVLPLWSFGNVLAQTDRLATSIAPPPAMGDVSTQLNRSRTPKGTGPLVVVDYWVRDGDDEFPRVLNELPLPIVTLVSNDWVSECVTPVSEVEECSDFRHIDNGDLFTATQDFGRAHLRVHGEPNQDARTDFPYLLFFGVLFLLFGAVLHRGRAVRYVVGPLVASASLWMVRASLDGFSRTAALFSHAERVLGASAEDLTLEQLMTEPVFDGIANTWPSWHYPFAFTALAFWLATTVGGIGLVRPTRRWTVVTITIAAAVVAWASWKYFDVAELANRIAE